MKNMKNIVIEWKHFDKEGKTCTRCSATGTNLAAAINEIRSELDPNEIAIGFRETKLPESRMGESNEIWIDGVLLEKLLPEAQAGMNECSSCGDLIGNNNCCCRTISQKENTFEEIPVALIREAMMSRLNTK